MRSPSESIAALIADTRSSSTSAGSAEAIIKPSTLTTAEASISGVFICKAFRCRTISSVLLAIQILLKTIGATRDLCNVCRTYDPGVAARRGSQSFYYTFWQRATRHVVTMRNLLTFCHDSANEIAFSPANLIQKVAVHASDSRI